MEKYIRNSRTISGRLHDELVMMNPEQGRYFSLNPVATRIWDLLEHPLDSKELCEILTEEYDVDPQKCLAEVRDWLGQMAKLGLINTTSDLSGRF